MKELNKKIHKPDSIDRRASYGMLQGLRNALIGDLTDKEIFALQRECDHRERIDYAKDELKARRKAQK